MKMIKRNFQKLMILTLCALLVSTPSLRVNAKNYVKQDRIAKEDFRLQDDFYEAVNKEWLQTAIIKEGYSLTSTLTDMSDQVLDEIHTIFEEIIREESSYKENEVKKQMLNFYYNLLNKEQRNREGIEPIIPYIARIHSISKIEDLKELLGDKKIGKFIPLIGLEVTEDVKDSKHYVLEIASTMLALGDADEYTMPTEVSEIKKEILTKYYENLLTLVGYDNHTMRTKIANVFKLEGMLAPDLLGSKEASLDYNLYETMYNAYTLEELNQLAPRVDIDKVIENRGYKKARKIILQEPKWLKRLNSIYTEENLELIKDYIELNFLDEVAGYISESFEQVQKNYNKELYGIEGELSAQEEAFRLTSSVFSDVLGKIYVKEYFSKEAKIDAQKLTAEIIEKYKERITQLDWMSEETKVQATDKLNHITIKMGYPKKWESYKGLRLKSYEEGGGALENIIAIHQFIEKKNLKKLNKLVDKLEFAMPVQMVNACYVPTNNDITFPAAILREPLYSMSQSKETNLGAIGAVIGHEITHAFDNHGARFDKNGNLKDWWTKEDYEAFEKKVKKVRDFYNKIEVLPGEKVNGDLTVGENIADIGAIACMLDILEDIPDANYKAFFESWAKTWRLIATKEYRIQALKTDVHSPHKVRVNVTLQQFEAFYKAYGITEKDKMYIKPEERLSVW